MLDLTRNEIVLVISPNARPGSGTWIYYFPSYSCQDQPRLGVSDSLVAIGDDLFTDCGTYGQRVGGEVTVMSKADLLTGAQLHSVTYGPAPCERVAVAPHRVIGAEPVAGSRPVEPFGGVGAGSQIAGSETGSSRAAA